MPEDEAENGEIEVSKCDKLRIEMVNRDTDVLGLFFFYYKALLVSEVIIHL